MLVFLLLYFCFLVYHFYGRVFVNKFKIKRCKAKHQYPKGLFISLITTHIHNWLLQPFSQDYDDFVSHTICAVCINFIYKWRDLRLKVDSEWQMFEKLFQFYFRSKFLPGICSEEVAEEVFSYFSFHVWPGILTWALCLIRLQTTY